jgi:DNA-binding winged helix-turn-helix (wHTH) protein
LNFGLPLSVVVDRPRVIHFDGYEFDDASGELRRRDERVPLQEQPARALALLIAHPNRMVTREELIAHLWADGRHVQFDQGLNYCIRRVRAALGDRARSPRYVSTVGRLGYRWVGPPPTRHRRRPVWVAACIPAWPVAMLAAASLALTLVLPVNRMPSRPAPTAEASVRSVIDAMHVLSHALLEPGRASERERALQTLRSVAVRLVTGS